MCNLGLNTILSISVPVLNAIYPVSIVLILLGLTHRLWRGNRFVYPVVVGGTALVSVIYAMDAAGLPDLLARVLPLYSEGYGWLCVAAVLLLASALWGALRGRGEKK